MKPHLKFSLFPQGISAVLLTGFALGLESVSAQQVAVTRPLQPIAAFYVSGGAPGNATGFFSSDDDRPGIQAAIDAAVQWLKAPGHGSGIASVIFEQGGTYHLDTPHPIFAPFVLDIRDLHVTGRLKLLGRGATLAHRQLDNITLGINGADRVVVRDLFFDRDNVPFMDGIVESAVGDVLDVRYENGLSPIFFPPEGGPISHWGWVLDSAVPGRPKQGTASFYTAMSVTNPQPVTDPLLYRFVMDPIGVPVSQEIAMGDRFTYHYREGGGNIQIRVATDIQIRNVTSFAAGSMFVNAEFVDELKVVGCDVAIRDGYWRSLNGDGVHVKRSTNLVVENCSFAGVSDDAINITDVQQFTVIGNTFRDKRRHAIVLDSDDGQVPPGPMNSTFGLIQDNVAEFNGGSFVSHKGGEYATVTIQQNSVSNNNRTRTAGANRYVRFVSDSGPFALAGDIGSDNVWSDGDQAIVQPSATSTDRTWHIQEADLGRALIIKPRCARCEHLALHGIGHRISLRLGCCRAQATPKPGEPRSPLLDHRTLWHFRLLRACAHPAHREWSLPDPSVIRWRARGWR